MRVNLVYAPFANSPSTVPLGVATLKSYLEEGLEGVDVKTIDLNLNWINKVVEGDIKGICKDCKLDEGFKKRLGCLVQKPFLRGVPVDERPLFGVAKDVVKDRSMFYNRDLIVRYVYPFYAFVYRYAYCSSQILRRWLEGRRVDEEFVFDFLGEEVERAVEGDPDVLGFSTLIDSQIHYALAMAKIVKEEYGLPVVLGGAAFSIVDLRELLEAFGFIDFVVVKEGELAMLKLLENLDGSYEGVPNLVWRKKGEIVFNEERMMDDLDVLPTPDFSDLDLEDYYFPELILPISASRNCPWGVCRFCQLNANHGGKYRQRSVGKVVDDIKALSGRYGARHFLFTDSEITPRRLKSLGQALSRENPKISFSCYARPTKGLTLDVLRAAYDGGCRFLMLGVEFLSDEALKFVNKGTTAESIMNVLKNASRAKIKLTCFMLCGIPTQTREELYDDMRKIASLQKKHNIFNITYTPFNLGKYVPFYLERERHGIEVTGRRLIYSTAASKMVHGEDWLEYGYGDKSAYGLLKSGLSSWGEAIILLAEKCQESGINQNNMEFITTIDNFLFETQLLYAINSIQPSETLHRRIGSFLKRNHDKPSRK